jgi:hypothetical protein
MSFIRLHKSVVPIVLTMAILLTVCPHEALATSLMHPSIDVRLMSPTGPILADANYTFCVWLINNGGIFSETGQNAQLNVVLHSGGKITEISSPSSNYFSSNYLIIPSYAHFGSWDDFKERTAKIAVFTIETAHSGILSFTISGQVEDKDSGWPDYNHISTAEASFNSSIIPLNVNAPQSFVELASARSDLTEDNIKLYRDYILYGNPFSDVDRFAAAQDIVDTAGFASDTLEATEVLFTFMEDPAAGILQLSTDLLGDVLNMPSIMSVFDWATNLLSMIDRELTYHYLESTYLAKLPLDTYDGSLDDLKSAQLCERIAWINEDYTGILSSLDDETSAINEAYAQVGVDLARAQIKQDGQVVALFQMIKTYVEQEQQIIQVIRNTAIEMQKLAPSPNLISPLNGSTQDGHAICFNWNSVPGATDYRLTVSSTKGTPFDDWVGPVTTVCLNNFPNDRTTYNWRVEATTAAGKKAYSDVWTFTNGSSASSPIHVDFPNSGNIWNIGAPATVRWTAPDLVGNVDISLSRDGGQSWTSIVPNAPNDGIETWSMVTSPTTDQARIRVSSVSNTGIFDESDGVFSIFDPSNAQITVLTPNGGEIWPEGTQQTITWAATGISGTVDIQITDDPAHGNWGTIGQVPADQESFTWTVEFSKLSLLHTTGVRVAVSAHLVPVWDMSDNDFSVVPSPSASVHVDSPNGSEIWYVNQLKYITWSPSNPSYSVAILLSRDGGQNWTTVVSDLTANDGSYDWFVTGPPTAHARIKILFFYFREIWDISDFDFQILSRNAVVHVDAPNGGEVLPVGSVKEIRWTPADVAGDVNITISRDNGTTWQPLATVDGNAGVLPWTVTGPSTDQARIKVFYSITGYGSTEDQSDNVFSIVNPLPVGTIIVTSVPPGFPFSLSGAANFSSLTPWGRVDLPPGYYTITWGSMSGYIAPAQEVKELSANSTISFQGNYALPQTGSIEVLSTPTGASFSLSGAANYTGITPWDKMNIPEGDYTITFEGMSGYQTPAPKTDTLAAYGTTSFQGNYAPLEEMQLPLQAGWNMISLPVEPETTDQGVILPDAEVIYTWNCTTTFYDSPSEIVPGKGYWALVFEDATETISGAPVEGYELSSDCAGWHMIGGLSMEAEIIVNSGDVYDTLYYWNPETLAYVARPLNDVRPGEGYWLLAFTDFSISVVAKPPA